jgi:hypothetical protein
MRSSRQWSDFFYPPALSEHPKNHLKVNVLVSFAWGLIPFWLLPITAQGFLSLRPALIVTVALILIPFWLRVIGRFSPIGHTIALIVTGLNFYAFYLDGARHFTLLWWQAVPPVIVMIVIGIGSGLFWLLIGLGGLLVFRTTWMTDRLPAIEGLSELPVGDETMMIVHLVGSAVLLTFGALCLERARARALPDRKAELDRSTSLLANLQSLQIRVRSQTQRLRSSSKQLSGFAEKMKTNAVGITAMTTDTSAAIYQSSESIRGLSETLEITADQMNEIRRTSTEAETKGAHGNQIAAESNETIEKIEEAGGKIESIVAVINEIADSAHLVSLNAAIEAANAGEHGRGFTFVVEEIRKLAKRSNDAVVSIRQQIRQGAFVLKSGRDVVSDTLDVFEKIHEYVISMAWMIQESTDAIHEQHIGIQEIAKGSTEISAVADVNAASIRELSAAIDDSYQAIEVLNKASAELEALTAPMQTI